jgi:hypothetical protein
MLEIMTLKDEGHTFSTLTRKNERGAEENDA